MTGRRNNKKRGNEDQKENKVNTGRAREKEGERRRK